MHKGLGKSHETDKEERHKERYGKTETEKVKGYIKLRDRDRKKYKENEKTKRVRKVRHS